MSLRLSISLFISLYALSSVKHAPYTIYHQRCIRTRFSPNVDFNRRRVCDTVAEKDSRDTLKGNIREAYSIRLDTP